VEGQGSQRAVMPVVMVVAVVVVVMMKIYNSIAITMTHFV
jgi:hypothetical protein